MQNQHNIVEWLEKLEEPMSQEDELIIPDPEPEINPAPSEILQNWIDDKRYTHPALLDLLYGKAYEAFHTLGLSLESATEFLRCIPDGPMKYTFVRQFQKDLEEAGF